METYVTSIKVTLVGHDVSEVVHLNFFFRLSYYNIKNDFLISLASLF